MGATTFARVADHRGGEINVVERFQHQCAARVLNVDTGRAIKRDVAAAAAQRTDTVDIASGDCRQAAAALKRAADVVNINAGAQIQLVAADKAAVVQVVGRQLRDVAPGDMAAVGEIVIDVQRNIVAAEQCAAAVEIAFFYANIELRHHNLLRAAVRQGDALPDQPDHIAGQQRHLLRGERHAGDQPVRFTEENAGVHQGAELRFVVVIPGKKALPGKANDLLADQLLLVIAVAKALENVVRILSKLLLHVIAAEPLTLVGIARIGLDQERNVVVGMQPEQAVIR